MADESGSMSGAGSAAGSQVAGLPKLTFEEISDLNERKARIKAAHTEYLASHPELKTMISDFMASLLMEKPDNAIDFAREHFARYAAAAEEAAEKAAAAAAEAEAAAAEAAGAGEDAGGEGEDDGGEA